MRTSGLQYLYLQKPVTLTILICILSILPWIGLGDFSTKGEPREAAVAVSMLETGNWVLPSVYADEFAYKPPLAHWLMAIASLPEGHVTEFSSRLPSALAFIVLMGFVLVFFGKRLRFQEAFIATLLLITCIEFHRAAMTTRVDMLLTAFIVIGLFQLYRWEDISELKGLPIAVPLLLGCAALTKGPVGIIVPLFVFGTYLLMLRKYSLLTIFKALLYAFVSSLFLPILWYIAAWKKGGDEFLDVVLAENFGRFFGSNTPEINYNLGHDNGVWFNFVTILLGFMPWTILFVFSLFGLKYTAPHKSLKKIITDSWHSILSMEKEKLFSLVAIVCILFFYSIPSSKRSVYLLPAYPFIAIFLSQYALYITEYKRCVTRTFAWFLGVLMSIIVVAIGLLMTGISTPESLIPQGSWHARIVNEVELYTTYITNPNALSIFLYIVLLSALATLFYQLFKKINLKILYATIGLTLAAYLMIDGVIMRSARNNTSSKPFATYVKQNYPITQTNMFVMNNLMKYSNLYGLNFYLNNDFHDFEDKVPSNGYLFCVEKDIPKIEKEYGEKYKFEILTSTNKRIADVRDQIYMCKFSSK